VNRMLHMFKKSFDYRKPAVPFGAWSDHLYTRAEQCRGTVPSCMQTER
jgi:hypothetical protein